MKAGGHNTGLITRPLFANPKACNLGERWSLETKRAGDGYIDAPGQIKHAADFT